MKKIFKTTKEKVDDGSEQRVKWLRCRSEQQLARHIFSPLSIRQSTGGGGALERKVFLQRAPRSLLNLISN
ncbi:3-isopropylmalate dehydratase large subunit [Trichinella spiralis]|uniref:3-isopropylmalate dehydratase large subunit n=1 Tax=Trichinella spiralis TaxID=6334 RepID=A0ABR3KXN5_TRISP